MVVLYMKIIIDHVRLMYAPCLRCMRGFLEEYKDANLKELNIVIHTIPPHCRYLLIVSIQPQIPVCRIDNLKLQEISNYEIQVNVNYSEEELRFIKEHNCDIVSQIKLSKIDFSGSEYPRRMLKYDGTYIAEILDNERDELVWAVLSKWKGVYHFSSIYDGLSSLEQGL